MIPLDSENITDWRNWYTHRIANPAGASPWGFDPPIRLMAKRRQTPDRPRDVNQLAARIVAISTGQVEDTAPKPASEAAKRRGEARAESLTKQKRRKIAKKAAAARWQKR
jgi:hypothetical protein